MVGADGYTPFCYTHIHVICLTTRFAHGWVYIHWTAPFLYDSFGLWFSLDYACLQLPPSAFHTYRTAPCTGSFCSHTHPIHIPFFVGYAHCSCYIWLYFTCTCHGLRFAVWLLALDAVLFSTLILFVAHGSTLTLCTRAVCFLLVLLIHRFTRHLDLLVGLCTRSRAYTSAPTPGCSAYTQPFLVHFSVLVLFFTGYYFLPLPLTVFGSPHISVYVRHASWLPHTWTRSAHLSRLHTIIPITFSLLWCLPPDDAFG